MTLVKTSPLTFVDLGRRVSGDTLGTLARFPAPDTSGPRHWDIELVLDRLLVHIQWEVIGGGQVRADSFGLEAGWDQRVVRLLHLQRAVAPLQPCVNSPLLSSAASILCVSP